LVVETEEDLLKGAYDNLDNTRAYYDHLSQKYDEVVVKKWGYNMPSCVAKMCVEVLRIPLSARVLDLGCGSGLVGAELQKHGYNAFTGVDISEASLRIAKGRNVYVRLKVGNLSECLVPKVLPRESMFNLLVCVGTTSYLSPDVLNGWSRLVRPGGILVLTHKTEVWKIWEPIQNELVRRGILEHVITSEEMLYLPGFSVNSRENERAKIYAFRRPKSSS
jgi:predicted TPR repeat methyltransferase